MFLKDLVRNAYYAICNNCLRIGSAVCREINRNVICGFHCYSLYLCLSDYKLNFAGHFIVNFNPMNDLGRTSCTFTTRFSPVAVRRHECVQTYTEKPCLEP
jgi:hypothetical protein